MLLTAMDAICQKARAQGCRIWIDAEQQSLQIAIDSWTVDLMRRYNSNGTALVYNTIQAYLKNSRRKLEEHLALAANEGWTMGVKLVRGAYLGNDNREGIHNTKADTDESYDSIIRDLLSGSNLGAHSRSKAPKTELFLAGHNPNSVIAAMNLIESLGSKGQLKTMPDFGQLQGMADELGCGILQKCEELRRSNDRGSIKAPIPRVYKCLTWGSVQECMQYLIRRVVENSGGADRMRDGMVAYRAELKRRILGRLGKQGRHSTI